MITRRKLPVGIQSFERLRSRNFLYVDKTHFVWELANLEGPTFLSRPRRFGKSLLVTTMKAYFEGKKHLFEGLAIHDLENDKYNPWQEYPVLHLDFSKGKYESKKDLEDTLNDSLSIWEGIYGKSETETNYSLRFYGVIKRACEKTGKKVVILVDEYDKPMLGSVFKEDHLSDEYKSILKGFYGVIKSSDEYLRFVFITGVTKFSKVSIFSDLNNLLDISNLNDYSDICGITQEELDSTFDQEIKALGDTNNISYEESMSMLKQRYNGYNFSRSAKPVYNPFSILNVFLSKEFKNYWFATGTPTFLVNFIKSSNLDISRLDGDLELGEHVLENYRVGHDSPIPIMFQAGYLTIKGYDPRFEKYILGFPNDEVRYSFLHCLIHDYIHLGVLDSANFIEKFILDIESDNIPDFMQRIKSIIAGIPYDNLPSDKQYLREQNYQTAVYLIFKLMGQFTHSEVHTAKGRCDCLVETNDHIYIFEFKLSGNLTSEDALNQILDKGYAEPYKSFGKQITAIGSVFDEDERTLKDWMVKELYHE